MIRKWHFSLARNFLKWDESVRYFTKWHIHHITVCVSHSFLPFLHLCMWIRPHERVCTSYAYSMCVWVSVHRYKPEKTSLATSMDTMKVTVGGTEDKFRNQLLKVLTGHPAMSSGMMCLFCVCMCVCVCVCVCVCMLVHLKFSSGMLLNLWFSEQKNWRNI